MIKHLDLFSGIGGFALAAQWAGFETVAFCEIEDYPRKVLEKNFPGVPIHRDIRTLTQERLWELIYAQDAKQQQKHQEDHIASHATQNKCVSGGTETEKNTEKHKRKIQEKRKIKSLITMEESVPVVARQKELFSVLTTKTITGTQNVEDTNLKHGNLQSSGDCQMTIKSSATTAIMPSTGLENVHTKKVKIDVITAGVPCQPASNAGKQRGAEDDRWLWPEAIRVVQEFHPRWVVFENVYGFVTLNGGMEFDKVLSQMEALGYEVQSFIIPACAVDAPHRRDRVWIIANARSEQYQSGGDAEQREKAEELSPDVADHSRELRHRCRAIAEQTRWGEFADNCNVCNANKQGLEERENQPSDDGEEQSAVVRADRDNVPNSGCRNGERPRREKRTGEEQVGRISKSSLGRGNDGLSSRLDRFDPGWSTGEWEAGIPRVATGITNRVHRLKGLGNAIVPQVAYQILKPIGDSYD